MRSPLTGKIATYLAAIYLFVSLHTQVFFITLIILGPYITNFSKTFLVEFLHVMTFLMQLNPHFQHPFSFFAAYFVHSAVFLVLVVFHWLLAVLLFASYFGLLHQRAQKPALDRKSDVKFCGFFFILRGFFVQINCRRYDHGARHYLL